MNPIFSSDFSLFDKILGAIDSVLSENSLNVFLCSISINLITTSVHLSPTISNAVVTGQLHRKNLSPNNIITKMIITIKIVVILIIFTIKTKVINRMNKKVLLTGISGYIGNLTVLWNS